MPPKQFEPQAGHSRPWRSLGGVDSGGQFGNATTKPWPATPSVVSLHVMCAGREWRRWLLPEREQSPASGWFPRRSRLPWPPRPQYRDVRLAEGSAAGSDRLADAELVDQLVNAFLADAGAAPRPGSRESSTGDDVCRNSPGAVASAGAWVAGGTSAGHAGGIGSYWGVRMPWFAKPLVVDDSVSVPLDDPATRSRPNGATVDQKSGHVIPGHRGRRAPRLLLVLVPPRGRCCQLHGCFEDLRVHIPRPLALSGRQNGYSLFRQFFPTLFIRVGHANRTTQKDSPDQP